MRDSLDGPTVPDRPPPSGRSPLRPYHAVPLTRVRIRDSFWAPRLRANRERTLPAIYRQCHQTGRIDAFRLDWQPGKEPVPHIFWDSDVAKWIEAASYALTSARDPRLEAMLEEVVGLVVAAQQPDGYLNVHFTVVEPERRWANLRDNHELYCAGHLMEAAVAHHRAAGRSNLLAALCRYADYIGSVFGAEPGKKRGYCGHEEIELALIKLYHATGQDRYLQLSHYFVEERGRLPHYYHQEARARGEDPQAFWAGSYAYCQAHAPVREQTEVVGHAVRAMYLYSAMADLAGELDDASLLAACERLWQDLTLRKLYLTGGIGPARQNEGFTGPYHLPNQTAYAETCAAIGLVLWSHRMLQFDCDSRYADVMELALYNGVLSGISLDGERFFYVNPLASRGDHHRQSWFDCACCPPNLARLLASLPGYVYSVGGAACRCRATAGGPRPAPELAVHLYVAGEVSLDLPGEAKLTLRQDTSYPWQGTVRLLFELAPPQEFTLRLRVPGWCRRHSLALNGRALAAPLARGYLSLARTWRAGDTIELDLDMPVEQVLAHPGVADDQGRVALQRGPLVYCLEAADYRPAGSQPATGLSRLSLPRAATLRARFDPALLNGVVAIEGKAAAADEAPWRQALYLPADRQTHSLVDFRAIPYYAWDNRQPGEMAVWLPRG
jgi:hypothetical protein